MRQEKHSKCGANSRIGPAREWRDVDTPFLAIHRAFFVLGGMTLLSTIVFRGQKKEIVTRRTRGRSWTLDKDWSEASLLPAEKALDHEVQSRMLQIPMNKRLSVLQLVTLAIMFCLIAPRVSAHERDTYKIGNKYYVITVGSLNEPFVVDNMSGVDLRVSQVLGAGGKDANKVTGKGTPVTGLEQTLKVELAAGDKKETLSLDPSDSAPGAYTAVFIPTVQTTYSYRIFGTISSNPVDLTFACVPGEVSDTAEDKSQMKVSETVTQIDKVGAFGCPAARNTAGFPEPAVSSYELNQNLQNVATAARMAGKQATTAQMLSIVGLIAALSGLAIAMMAWKRK